MTNEEAIEEAKRLRFEVDFRDCTGDIAVYKWGERFIGPSDIGGYGQWERHRIARGKDFAKVVAKAIEALPRMDFRPQAR